MNLMQFTLPPGTVARVIRSGMSRNWESELSWATQQGWRVLAIFEETLYENQDDRRRRNGDHNVFSAKPSDVWITSQTPCFLLVQDEGTAVEQLTKEYHQNLASVQRDLEAMSKKHTLARQELAKVQNKNPTPLETQVMDYKVLVEKQQEQIALLEATKRKHGGALLKREAEWEKVRTAIGDLQISQILGTP